MKDKPHKLLNIAVMFSLLLSITTPVLAANQTVKAVASQGKAYTAQTPDGLKIDVSAPVTPKISRAVRDLPVASVKKTSQREINRPRGAPETRGTDKNIQDPLAANSLNQGRTPDPLLTFEGIGDLNLYTPPDTNGDVGPDHYVQIVNVMFAVYDKTGGLVSGPVDINSLWTGYGGPCELYNDGDPIVLYDDMADRWMISQFAVETTPEYECVAVSTSPDPSGTYYMYGFAMPDFPDYPKFGVWPDGYYFGTNTGSAHTYYAHALDRASMLAGDPATRISFGGYDNLLLPADMDGQMPPPAGAPEYFYTVYAEGFPDHPAGVDRLAIYEFDADWATPANSTFNLVTEIPVAAFNYTVCGFFGPDCIPEPPPGVGLDSLSWWPMARLQYRNFGAYEAMVSNFTVDVDGSDTAGIRWFELQKTEANPWSLNQEGTYAPDASHRWMGAIAMDGSGDIALGYSVSDATVTKPSIRYAVHQYGDPPGTMQAEAVIMNGDGVNTGPYGRWGDYSAMNVDPVDQCTFWYTNEYHDVDSDSFNWNTHVGAFKVPTCSGSVGPSGTLDGHVMDSVTSAPIAGATIAASMSITQTFGATTDPAGDYQMVIPVGTYDVTASAFGYLPETVSGVDVISGTVTTQDFALDPAPAALVYGYITDATNGWPLYASFDVDGVPGGPFWNDPVTGYYEISLPQGASYDFSVQAWVPGYLGGFQTVGPLSGDIQVDFALEVDLEACSAPGYYIIGGLAESFDATTIPPGWTVVDNTGEGPWAFDNPGGQSNNTGGSGNFAIVDSDFYGELATEDTSMMTPLLDFSTYANVSLEFKHEFFYYEAGLYEYGDVDVSNDGGATWNNVASYNGADYQGTVSIDISTLAAGEPDVMVRWHYYDANYEWWWEVDDVRVGQPECVSQPGGLVVGNVYDANTSEALNSAEVANVGGFDALTMATPADPAVDDGFYTIFSPAGTQSHTASMDGGYAPSTIDVSVVASDTVAQDFFLDAGWLSSVDPTGLDVDVAEGYVVSDTLTLFNTGGAATSFEIKEDPRTLQAKPDAALPGSNPATARRIPLEKLSDTAPAAAPLVDIIQDGSFEAGTPNPYWEEFSTNFGTPICDAGACGTGGGTAGPRTGAFWAWFGGITAYEQGYLRQTLVIPSGTASLSLWLWIGTAGGPVEDYFNITVDGNEVFRATADEQPLYSTYTQVVVDISAYADGSSHIVELQSETFGTTTSNFNVDDVVLDSASAFDIPWLDEQPVTGTIDADSTADINVTFDSMTYTVGTQLKGMLTVTSDDPYGSMYEIPVTMTIGTLAYGVDVGADQAQDARPADTITYTVRVTNAGNGPTDSYTVTLGSSSFPTSLDQSVVGPLYPNEYAEVHVTVSVPAGTVPGAVDAVDVTATSHADPSLSDTASMTTTVIGDYSLTLEPPEASGSAGPGETITYTLTLSNTGDASTVDVTFGGNAWDVSLPVTSFDLGAGESVDVLVEVTVAAGALVGDSDTVTITATGLGGATDTSMLTTTVEARLIYLPLVMNNYTAP